MAKTIFCEAKDCLGLSKYRVMVKGKLLWVCCIHAKKKGKKNESKD